MFQRVTATLGTMRKPRRWHVQPTSNDLLIVQADGAIGLLDWRTGKGKLTTQGGYYPHLALARPFDFPADFVAACLAACPSQGGETALAGGSIVVKHSVQVF